MDGTRALLRGISTPICLLVLAGLAGLGPSAHNPEPQRFTVLQLNIWNEARTIRGGFDKIIDVILAADADIVAFSEVRNRWWRDWHERVVERLGSRGASYHGTHVGGDVGLISRFPIRDTAIVFDETDDDQGSIMAYRVELPGKRPLIVCSAHLDYRYYGLNLVRGYSGGYPDFERLDVDEDGNPHHSSDVDAVLAYNQRSRKDEAVEAFLDFAASEAQRGVPIVLAGDFNDGSHLDWVEKTRDSFGHNGLVISWPNTRRLEERGFLDAYRMLFPDPLANPGITWPAPAFGKKSTSWVPMSDERDRIDYILFSNRADGGNTKGTLRPIAGWIVGPRGTFAYDQPTANVGHDLFRADELPWPSDHKGVLIEFEYTPAAAPNDGGQAR